VLRAETVHRVCHRCKACVPLRAEEQELHQVPHLEDGGIHYLRIPYHGSDRPQYAVTYDEGKYVTLRAVDFYLL